MGRNRRDWVITATYVASVIVGLLVRDAVGASWHGFLALYFALSAGLVFYYRATR